MAHGRCADAADRVEVSGACKDIQSDQTRVIERMGLCALCVGL